jgi:D-erythro-7,8-dihydroneopterin triphosphate epimerase
MIVKIKNLRLRAIIGVNEWERVGPQDVTLNIELEYDASKAAASDAIADAVDYHAIKHRILAEVEQSRFGLLEKLAAHVLGIVMSDARVGHAVVEIDKPHALRFADSVSVTASATR